MSKIQYILFLTALLSLFSIETMFSQVHEFNTSGSNTISFPIGTVLKVETWGGGGRGGTRTDDNDNNGSGGGGGGGAYASSIITVTQTADYTVNVGSGSSNNSNPGGDSWFSTNTSVNNALVLAKGGSSVPNNNSTGAAGGYYDDCIGDIRNNGGRGADGDHSTSGHGGGGGGSSAGATGVGVNATNNFGAVGPSGYDGIGGNGATSQGNGSTAVEPGGGGGGARRTNSGTRSGGNGANGRVIITDITNAAYDLTITKTVDNNVPLVGTNVIFTTTVENTSPSTAATGIEVLDLLPNGLSYVNHTTTGGISYSNTTGQWNIGTLNAGNSVTLVITATVNVSGSYASTAILDADKENREVSQSTITLFPQQPTTNLQLTKEVDNAMPLIGEEVTFTLTVYNGGPQNATGVEVVDILPFGLSHVSNSGGYDSNTGIWTIGTLNNGATATLMLTTKVNPTGNHYNQAVVSGNEFDPDLTNNSSGTQVYPTYPLTEIVLPCGTTTYNLTSFTIGTPPPGAEISWHTESPAYDTNKIATPGNVRAGQKYYVAFYDPVQNCYGSTSEVKITRSCLITNPMIRQRTK